MYIFMLETKCLIWLLSNKTTERKSWFYCGVDTRRRYVCPISDAVLPGSVSSVICGVLTPVFIKSKNLYSEFKAPTDSWIKYSSFKLLFILRTMGSVQSCVFFSISAYSAYFLYVHVYRSHKLLKTEINYNKLPTFAYLYLKYLSRAVARRKGRLYATNRCDLLYTIVNCRWASVPGTFEHLNSVLLILVPSSGPGWTPPCWGASAALRVTGGITRTPSSETSRCAFPSFSAPDFCSWYWLMDGSGSAQQVGKWCPAVVTAHIPSAFSFLTSGKTIWWYSR